MNFDIAFFQFVNFEDVTPLCYDIFVCEWHNKIKFNSFFLVGNPIVSDIFHMCHNEIMKKNDHC